MWTGNEKAPAALLTGMKQYQRPYWQEWNNTSGPTDKNETIPAALLTGMKVYQRPYWQEWNNNSGPTDRNETITTFDHFWSCLLATDVRKLSKHGPESNHIVPSRVWQKMSNTSRASFSLPSTAKEKTHMAAPRAAQIQRKGVLIMLLYSHRTTS